MKKRLLSLLLALALLLTLLPNTALPASAGDGYGDYSGDCGDFLTWRFDPDTGVLTIEGEGDMERYAWVAAPWYLYNDQVTTLLLPEGLLSIGNDAFSGFSALAAVKIPESVTTIHHYAFYNSGLTEATVPAGVERVGIGVFANCPELGSVTFLNPLCDIGDNCFAGSDKVTIRGYDGSTAELYAQAYGLPFMSLGQTEIGGRCGNKLSWSFDPGSGVITIEGVGDMEDFWFDWDDYDEVEINHIPWYVLRDRITGLSLPEGLTSISYFAFAECSLLRELCFSENVERVGYCAFEYCENLESAIFLNPVCAIGDSCFEGCGQLTIYGYDCSSAEICAEQYGFPFVSLGAAEIGGVCGDDLTWSFDSETGLLRITGSGAMWDFWSEDEEVEYREIPWYFLRGRIEALSLPEGLLSIGSNAFRECAELTQAEIPESVRSIGDRAFSYCDGLTEIVLPEEMDYLSGFAYCCNLRSVTMPKRAAALGHKAFCSCELLTEIEIPEGVEWIGWAAFRDCAGLTELVIPDSVTEIVWEAFARCYNLRSLQLPKNLTGIGDSLLCDCSSLTELTIPDGVGWIGNEAFSGCAGLTELVIPDSVTSIGGEAFWGCAGLESIHLPKNLEGINDGLFSDCVSLTAVDIPESVRYIGWGAFRYCDSLRAITLPEAVSYVDERAFRYCGSLEAFTVLNPMCELAYDCLEGCDRVTVYGYSYSTAESYAEEHGLPFVSLGMPQIDGVCGDNLTWSFDAETGLLTIEGWGDMYDYDQFDWQISEVPWRSFCEEIQEISLPEGLTHIGSYAFLGCAISRISVPEGVLSIGGWAFHNCDKLKTIELPASLLWIGSSAFDSCGLTELQLPEQLEIIEERAFFGCDDLTELVLPDSLTFLGRDAFSNCDGLTEVTLSGHFQELDGSVFAGCGSLRTVRLAAGFSLDYKENNIPAVFYDFSDYSLVENGDFDYQLSAYQVDADNPMFSSDAEGVLYSKDGSVLVAYPTGKTGAFTMTETVTEISKNAFFNCDGLSGIQFSSRLERIDECAFAFCDGMTEPGFPEALRYIGYCAFVYCQNLSQLRFGEMLERIDPFAFAHCSSLRSVHIPGATEIGGNAFTDCPQLFELVCRDPEALAQEIYYMLSIDYPDETDEDMTEPIYEEVAMHCSATLGISDMTLVFGVHDDEKENAEPVYRGNPEETELSHDDQYRYVENYAKTYGYRFCGLGSFNDVEEDSYYELPVAWAAAVGVTGGTGDGKFSPKQTCTREQIVTFLWKAAGAPEPKSTENPFTDVKSRQYYYKAVLWAVENGITGGVGEGRFGVGQTCTREQAVSFLWRAKGSPEPKSTENPFTDVKSKQYYYKAVLWAVENGITGGVGNNKFGVGVTCTRAQIVTFLYKTYTLPDAEPESAEWSVIGNICGTGWDTDFPMTETEENVFESEILELHAGEEFRIRANQSWDMNYGAGGQDGGNFNAVLCDGDNFVVVEDGSYIVRLDLNSEVLSLIAQ